MVQRHNRHMPMSVYLAAIAVVDTTMLLIGKLKLNFKYFFVFDIKIRMYRKENGSKLKCILSIWGWSENCTVRKMFFLFPVVCFNSLKRQRIKEAIHIVYNF